MAWRGVARHDPPPGPGLVNVNVNVSVLTHVTDARAYDIRGFGARAMPRRQHTIPGLVITSGRGAALFEMYNAGYADLSRREK